MRNVALDLGAKSLSYCEVRDGAVIARTTVRSLHQLTEQLGPNSPPAKVAFEACREAWRVHDWLEAHGHVPLMLDTTRTRRLGVGQHRRKTDRLDAEAMAHAVERGVLPLAHVLSPARRVLREQLSVRRALVETRAQWVTTIRGLLRGAGIALGGCRTQDFVPKVRAANLPEEMRALVEPLLLALEALEVQAARVEARLDELCAREPLIPRLCTVPGVGLITAATFISVIDDAGRFRDAHQVASYLGLAPSEHSSGGPDKRRLGSISKHGNPQARAMLVQAAWALMRSAPADDPLRRWAEGLASRRKPQVAAVALARKLAGLLFALWRDGSVYDPGRAGRETAQGMKAHASQTERDAQTLERAAKKLAARTRRATAASRTSPVSPAGGNRRRGTKVRRSS